MYPGSMRVCTVLLAITGSWNSAPSQVTKDPGQEVTRRPQTQAVVGMCREKGRQADTRHTLGVFKAAVEILKVRSGFPEIASADPLTVEVAAMLHDIGGGGYANAKPGAAIAREVLASLRQTQGFSDAFIDKICRLVETHHLTDAVKGKDDSPEWYVVLLADTPKVYSASAEDVEAFSKLIRERIEQLKNSLP